MFWTSSFDPLHGVIDRCLNAARIPTQPLISRTTTMSAQTEQTFLVGGLEANVYSRSSQTPGPAVVMFVLHGRHGNCKDPATTSIVNGLLQNNAKQSRNLYVVTFVSIVELSSLSHSLKGATGPTKPRTPSRQRNS